MRKPSKKQDSDDDKKTSKSHSLCNSNQIEPQMALQEILCEEITPKKKRSAKKIVCLLSH